MIFHAVQFSSQKILRLAWPYYMSEEDNEINVPTVAFSDILMCLEGNIRGVCLLSTTYLHLYVMSLYSGHVL